MRLLTSQKDTLFDIIEEFELSPSQFQFSDGRSVFSTVGIATRLYFKNSEFHFSFDSVDNRHYASFCPGEQAFQEEANTLTWDQQLYCFQGWLENLKREINSPNKWDRLDKEIKGLRIKFENEEDKFSAQEYQELKIKIDVLKKGVDQIGLLAEQVSVINSKLDHLTELAQEMNKFDWKSLFIGTIISIIIQLNVTAENAKSLWALIKRVFSNYFLP